MDDHPRMPDDDPVNDPARRRAIGSLAGGIAAVGMAGAARGQTLVDRRSVAEHGVEVAEAVDSAAAVEFLVSRLETYGA